MRSTSSTDSGSVDEPESSLGESLVLPEWLEDRREAIESEPPELERATRAAE